MKRVWHDFVNIVITIVMNFLFSFFVEYQVPWKPVRPRLELRRFALRPKPPADVLMLGLTRPIVPISERKRDARNLFKKILRFFFPDMKTNKMKI